MSHNYPGFADGISGVDLLQQLGDQANHYDVTVEKSWVTSLSASTGGFTLQVEAERVLARNVILATGVEDLKPQMPQWREATLAGTIRWCPICDGYEATDQSIAVMSGAREGYRHALFLRTYTDDLTLIIEGSGPPLTTEQSIHLQACGVRVVTAGLRELTSRDGGIGIAFDDDTRLEFDTLYPMIGCAPRVELLREFAPRLDENNLLWVDEHQCTSIPGIYAAGDVVRALNQMTVGAAHAATAATAVHHRLPPNFR